MNETKKALSGAGTTDRATETAALTGAAISANQYTTTGKRTQGPVEALLLRGEGNAIPTARLVQLAGMRDARQLQAQIEHERIGGALILSKGGSGGGYFLPADRSEIVKYEATLRRRALSTLRTIKSARAALRVLPGQEVLDG